MNWDENCNIIQNTSKHICSTMGKTAAALFQEKEIQFAIINFSCMFSFWLLKLQLSAVGLPFSFEPISNALAFFNFTVGIRENIL